MIQKQQVANLQAGGSNHAIEVEATNDDDAKDHVAASAISSSNRPKVHDLFHILGSIPMRGLPKYHSCNA